MEIADRFVGGSIHRNNQLITFFHIRNSFNQGIFLSVSSGARLLLPYEITWNGKLDTICFSKHSSCFFF